MSSLNEMAERLMNIESGMCLCDSIAIVLGEDIGPCPKDENGNFMTCGECKNIMKGKLVDALEEAAGELAKSGLPSMPTDADGFPCLLDDAVWHKGRKHAVVAVSHKGKVCIRDWETRDSGNGAVWVKADTVSHVKHDTLEDIEADAKKEVYEYWACNGFCCSECPAKIDGKMPRERYSCFDCSAAKALDLLERQRKLLGGE